MLGWVTVLECQFLVIVFRMRLLTKTLGASIGGDSMNFPLGLLQCNIHFHFSKKLDPNQGTSSVTAVEHPQLIGSSSLFCGDLNPDLNQHTGLSVPGHISYQKIDGEEKQSKVKIYSTLKIKMKIRSMSLPDHWARSEGFVWWEVAVAP